MGILFSDIKTNCIFSTTTHTQLTYLDNLLGNYLMCCVEEMRKIINLCKFVSIDFDSFSFVYGCSRCFVNKHKNSSISLSLVRYRWETSVTSNLSTHNRPTIGPVGPIQNNVNLVN